MVPVALDLVPDDGLDGPLSSVGLRPWQAGGAPHSAARDPAVRPLVLRIVRPAPDREVPEHVYDPQRQIATDLAGQPLGPNLKKEWTTVEGTHTDGDGGDNELWDWEEVR
jgi:putative ATP-grasp target RiPP